MAKQKKLDNVVFMGSVSKLEIPSVLSQSDINILHNSSTTLDKYGQSQNKFFEYLASGRPILMTYKVGYSIVEGEQCGIEVEDQKPESIADAIQKICELPQETIEWFGENSKECAKKYDFKILTSKIEELIESL